jgi:RNA recognition motif-containing protein
MHNIHFDMREEDLAYFFKENKLSVVKMYFHKGENGRPKGTGSVEFENSRDATIAVKHLSGFEF